MNRDDLRSVQYTQIVQPEVGKEFTFRLISCQRGSLQPSVVKDEISFAHGKPPPKELIPLCRLPSDELSENSSFSRVTTASSEYLETLLFMEQQRLIEMRVQCLNGDLSSEGRGDTEWLPSVTEALRLLEGDPIYLFFR